jgi:hypothetical protein
MSVLPGWDSVESTATIAHGLHITAIVVLGLLFLSEGLALLYDFRKEHLTAVAEGVRAGEQKQKEDADEAHRRAEVDGLQTQLTEAHKKVSELEQKQAPRRLMPEQKQAFQQMLIPSP